jgi:hypothetical protein
VVINQIRSLLLESGVTLRKGRDHIDEALPGILDDASAKLLGALRVLLAQLKLELDHLQMRIDEADAVIKKTAGVPEHCSVQGLACSLSWSWKLDEGDGVGTERNNRAVFRFTGAEPVGIADRGLERFFVEPPHVCTLRQGHMSRLVGQVGKKKNSIAQMGLAGDAHHASRSAADRQTRCGRDLRQRPNNVEQRIDHSTAPFVIHRLGPRRPPIDDSEWSHRRGERHRQNTALLGRRNCTNRPARGE